MPKPVVDYIDGTRSDGTKWRAATLNEANRDADRAADRLIETAKRVSRNHEIMAGFARDEASYCPSGRVS